MKKQYILQIGLAFVLLYAGISSFIHPFDWIGFVPSWVTNFGMSRELALHLHAGLEIFLGLWLVSNIKIRWVAGVAAADILVILLVSGFGTQFLVTFRDVAIFLMALYLAL